MLIYLITNRVNGKKYVGQTVQTLKNRWSAHKSTARRGRGKFIANALRKYGEDTFDVDILTNCKNKKALDAAERWFIKMYQANDPKFGYNLSIGGGGRSGVHQTLSEEHKRKISLSRKGQSNSRPGYRHSEETRKKISISNKGRMGVRLGVVVSQATRNKLSIAQTLYHQRKHNGLSPDA